MWQNGEPPLVGEVGPYRPGPERIGHRIRAKILFEVTTGMEEIRVWLIETGAETGSSIVPLVALPSI